MMSHLWYSNPEPQLMKESVLLEELKTIHSHSRISAHSITIKYRTATFLASC